MGIAASGAAACTGTLGDPANGESVGVGLVGSGGPGSGQGGADTGSGSGSGGDDTEEQEPIETAPRLGFPRLSHSQWEATVVDLFRLDEPTGLAASFYPDPEGSATFDNNEETRQVTEELWLDYQRAAGEVATMVTGSSDLMARIGAAGDAETWIRSFGRRAYRRPLTSAEVDRYLTLFDDGAELDVEGTDPFVAGVRIVIEALLQSPHFVYRVELGGTTPDEEGNLPLTPFEIASRLSYTLWNTMPDDDLLDDAELGRLDDAAEVGEAVDRLLGSDRARAGLSSFVDQIFDAEQFETVTKNASIYPDWSEQTGRDMREELRLFADNVMFVQDAGLEELLLSRTTFVNARLAAIYGVPGDFTDDEFVEVELDERRAGILTLSGFLAWKGTPTATPDTILRGVYVNRRLLCTDLPNPPDEALGVEVPTEGGGTNRDRIDALTGEGTCGETCHGGYINPVGFAFEHFDSVGAWRDEDAGEPIDATGTFPFTDGEQSFDGAAELGAIMADSEEAHACWSQHWIEFTFGRRIADEDDGLVQQLTARSREGASARAMVREVMTSPAFLTRKPAEVEQ